MEGSRKRLPSITIPSWLRMVAILYLRSSSLLLHLLSSKPLILNHHCRSLNLLPLSLAAIAWAAGSCFTSSALLLYF
jgi:hypothetical protein